MRTVILVLTLLLSSQSRAQNCLESLLNAQKHLDEGNTEKCLQLVQNCISENGKESNKWQAYRLKSIAHLLQQQRDSAIQAAEMMLSIHPTYIPTNRNDPQEFIKLLQDIVVIPKFSLGLAISTGANISRVNVLQPYLLADYKKHYKNINGIEFGTEIGMSLNPNMVVQLGVLASVKKFGIEYAFSNWEVDITEKQTYLDFPLNLKYIFNPTRKLRPYLLGGVFGGYMMYDQASFHSTYLPENKQYSLNKLDMMDKRNRFNYGGNLGGGVLYKLNKGHFCFQASYFKSLANVNKAESRFSSDEQMFTYFYLDDDFRVDNFSLSVGGVYYLNYMVYRKKGS